MAVRSGVLGLVALLSLTWAGVSRAVVPWIVYVDNQTDLVCDVVNAANAELVVLADGGEFVIVTDTDTMLLDTVVDDNGNVFYLGEPAGFIDFAVDADGFRTLWWFFVEGDVANVNEFTGEPTPTGLGADQFSQVPCDVCEVPLWDDELDCLDADADGVDPRFDLCPDTPVEDAELGDVDADGCGCSQLDDDADGVNNCFDLCPDTPLEDIPDVDGCSCVQLDSDGDGVDDCIDICDGTPPEGIPDDMGCSCEQFDEDGDEINDCFDLCPGTNPSSSVDIDGCACDQVDDDADGINNCFDLCPNSVPGDVVGSDGCPVGGPPLPIIFCGPFTLASLTLTLAGLVGWRRRRRGTLQRGTQM